MLDGPSEHIEYVTRDNSPWRAALSEVRRGLFAGSASNPDFCHLEGTSSSVQRREPKIIYKSTDGHFWSSRCHARVEPATGLITFEFEHLRLGVKNGLRHQISDELRILDWAGHSWLVKVQPMNQPGQPMFIARPAACQS